MPLVLTYLDTGLVPRVPTAILITGMTIVAVLCLFSGLILDTVTRGRREVRRLEGRCQGWSEGRSQGWREDRHPQRREAVFADDNVAQSVNSVTAAGAATWSPPIAPTR